MNLPACYYTPQLLDHALRQVPFWSFAPSAMANSYCVHFFDTQQTPFCLHTLRTEVRSHTLRRLWLHPPTDAAHFRVLVLSSAPPSRSHTLRRLQLMCPFSWRTATPPPFAYSATASAAPSY